jgi:tetratricopeptide (TPR) repeat protein
MKDRENDHIEALNRCRYLIRDRIYPLKRGQLYNRLMGYLRSSECELNDFAKSEFLEGFAYVFMDLTDYKQSFKHAHDAFELKEGAALLSDRKEDELELLALLQLLGDLCGKMGDLDKAKDYYEKVISIATRFSRPWQRIQNEVGATDDDVILDNFLAIAQVAMARMYLNKGDIKNGKKFFEKGITVLRRIFCDVHPELSDAYVQYANVLSNYKNKIFFEEIISLFERALEIDRQLFEEDSRLLGERLEQYGVALLTMGNYGEAEIKLQKAYDIAANYYGEYDPYVAGICNNLAVALKNMKKGEKAEIMYKRSLDITTEVYGPDDYRVSIAKANLSQALIQLGKSEEAQQIFDEALKNLSGKPLEGETATVMASMLSTMGDAMREKKDFTRSIEYFEKALTIQKGNSRGVDKDIEIAKTLASIGRLYFDKGEYKLAEEMQQQSLSIVTNQYGKKHPLYSSSLTSLANTKFKLEKFSDAEKLYNESMEMRKENKEPDANNITTLQALAAVREKEKKWAEAEKMWSQIISILREMKVRDEAKERTALVALATNMARQQKFNEAETIYSDVLPMVAKEYGDDSIEYADLIYNLGAVYLQLQKFDDAEATFATAKTIYADKLGEDHDRTREVDDQLGEIRHLIYERDMAKRCCGGCLSGCVIA